MQENRPPGFPTFEKDMAWVDASPADLGVLEAISIRPRKNERRQLTGCEVSPEAGIHGDNWVADSWLRLGDNAPDPDVQVTLMNVRVISLIASGREKYLSGDQLYVDLALGEDNLPVGQRLRIGSAEFEITPEPHHGCRKFGERFGAEALAFVNSRHLRSRRLRGVHAKVVQAGRVSVGDLIRKV